MAEGTPITQMQNNSRNLKDLDFVNVPLKFEPQKYVNVFADKNNKSLAETLEHRRYVKLKPIVLEKYSSFLDQPLGKFLLENKQNGDDFYLRFLNKYGDLEYSEFSISDMNFFNLKGIYAYILGDEIKYIGRCRDQMKKRINQGYGKINPKNCYLDGQATNCHLNSRVTLLSGEVSLWLCAMDAEEEIESVERKLIQKILPPWNIQR